MVVYRERVRSLYSPIDPEAPLFPKLAVRAGGRLEATAKPMNDKAFLDLFRMRCRSSGLPDALVDRLSYHSFRSGGASDFFDYGAFIPGIIQFIMKQGRWAGPTFRIYLRLRSMEMADVAGRVMSEAATAAEREEDPSGPLHAQFQRLRAAVGEAEIAHRTHGARPRPRLAPPLFAAG